MAYSIWMDGYLTVGEVEKKFAEVCTNASNDLGEPKACSHFLDWFDDTPRYQMRRELLEEVSHELDRRQLATPLATTQLDAAAGGAI